MPSWMNMGMQNANSPLMEQLTFFHDYTMIIIVMILSIVAYFMYSIMMNMNMNHMALESHSLETFWTVIPAFILIFIGTPSIRLLYMLDEVFNPDITIKIMGHQWYWSYEYSDFMKTEFNSYMSSIKDIYTNQPRLLEVDNHTTIPYKSQVRVLVSSEDVLHSWTVPSLGIKADATPGRLNQLNFMANRPGLFFGQCSEICGANHSFMPIVIESLKTKNFIKWIKSLN